MSDYIYYINGDFVKSKNAKIGFDDGGFQRGNAIFETIRFNKNHLFSVYSHLKRLRDGLAADDSGVVCNKNCNHPVPWD